MLGRTANSLFWMFRYLERAENTARLLEAALRMALTRDLATAEAEWRSVIATLGLQAAFEANHDSYDGLTVWNFVLRAPGNAANVREMLGAVRFNARMARTNISSDVWEAVNDNWMKLDKLLARPVGQTGVGELLAAIRRTGTQVHGAFDGSMLRDEGYHFARAGTFIERADSTARILDMKYFLLLPSLSYVGSSLDTGQWEQVLRSVAGARVYSWLNAGQIEARGIVEFLVLDDRFPRSLAFCRNALRNCLGALAHTHGVEGGAVALMRDSDTRISHLTVDQIFEAGLHEFLIDFLARNAAIGRAIAEDYRFHA
ncbi:alpha-E domain-containing protein [Porphyrobacter sp. YT40]|uniref:alpha-E domain-containing protein n=1 Tax=Porphyrobacter sp. YT40 TaxID=2547601 RepID=UPI0011449D61|nr:alpha-E domain-containing protein [Porphyrobacter sp. YT40]QDH36141.1 alpha-E domain-containing protein [Porphyrobacter sp. YT40]